MSEFYVHPSALCESNSIGKGTRIWAFCHIMKNVVIGEDCNLGDHSFVESGVIIGNRVTVKNGVSVWVGVTIEDEVFLGPNCVLTNDTYPRSKVYYDEYEKIIIKKGATVGANATILPGVTLGEYCMVGAGSVVTKDVKSFSLVFGNPAKHRNYVCKFGGGLDFNRDNEAYDKENNKYLLSDGKVTLCL